MAEYIGEEKVINKDEPLIFENKTDSTFDVGTGIIFRKSGLYEVLITGNKTIVSKLQTYTEPDQKAIEDEVWEFAGKIFEMDTNTYAEIYDKGFNSYRDAKDKYEAWKKKKDEFHVGDEVLNRLGKPYVIYEIKNDSAYGIMFDEYPLNQECFSIYDTNKKTGRHFNQITEVLEQLKEAQDETK